MGSVFTYLVGAVTVIGWLMAGASAGVFGGHAQVSVESAQGSVSAGGVHPLLHRLTSAPAATIEVYVTGAVRRPGLYRLPLDARVQAAVIAAGGATRGADLAAVDLAAIALDGTQIVIPATNAVVQPAGSQYEQASSPGGMSGMIGSGRSHAGRKDHKLAPGERVDLNSATLAQLEEIPGVGPTKAGRILSYRAAHGLFVSLAQLASVPGIGPKLLAVVELYTTLGEQPPHAASG